MTYFMWTVHVHYKVIQKKWVFLYQLGDQHAVSPFFFQCLFVLAYLERETLKVAVISKRAPFLTDRISFKDWEILWYFTLCK